MIRFKPLGETRVDDVVATLEDLYAETAKPVSARQIGDVVGMQPHQTLAYLHEAKDAGRANPVPTNNPNWTKGWVPGSVVSRPNAVADNNRSLDQLRNYALLLE